MRVFVRTSGTLYNGDFKVTGVFTSLEEAQSARGGACGLDKSWEYLGEIWWRNSPPNNTWRREWGDDRDDIEEHEVKTP